MYERRVRARVMRRRPIVRLLVLVSACAALIGAPAASADPANDNFTSAQDVSLTPTAVGSNTDATPEAGEPDHGDPNHIAPNGACSFGVSTDGAVNPAFWGGDLENPPLRSVWFKWTAPGAGGCLTVNTFGSSFDTVMSVYTGAGYGSLTLVAGNDDYQTQCAAGALGVPTNSSESCVRFNSTPGVTYYIAVDSGATQFGGGGTGSYSLNWSVSALPTPDLAASKSTTATAVYTGTGSPIPYTILVTNHGTVPAPGSTLADTLTGATITSMSTDQGSCTAPTCWLGTIAGGQTVTRDRYRHRERRGHRQQQRDRGDGGY